MKDLLALLTINGRHVRFDVGRDSVVMSAIADGGTATGGVGGKAWPRAPDAVIGSLDNGGSIFFSAQYLIGCYDTTRNGFSVICGSSGLSAGAGWTTIVNWVAFWFGDHAKP